ncbi:hypothetical protein OXB_2975 [Bacillus sp. OxB-1]|uniref:phage tail assembly protein n=1 Tax=Bacillus sp. (strain OxB-1) TaxID=98228 RepID=UPI000581F85E|nr:phage tail assembly protein [Bacillus sp. OxB-1]BAQ11445.1 hypothetical protein OXB_2975 [Bacillus sp. OxB-1]
MTENMTKDNVAEELETKENQVETEHNPLVINMPIRKPLSLDGKEIKMLNLDFSNMTGTDILSIDSEMRLDGHPGGFDHIYNQDALLKIASRATGVLPDDLKRLHGADFLEMVFQVRNFFVRW